MISGFNIEKDILKLFKRISRAVFAYHKQKDIFEIDARIVNKDEIRKENFELRNVDKATDVLSMPAFEKISLPVTKKDFSIEDFDGNKVLLGSILICEEVAKEQATEYGHSFQREVGFLFCHGLLHLLGYDHVIKEDEKVMLEVQKEIMNRVGLYR